MIHLAGYKYAGESVRHPLHTYTQNVTGTVELLEAMREADGHRDRLLVERRRLRNT